MRTKRNGLAKQHKRVSNLNTQYINMRKDTLDKEMGKTMKPFTTNMALKDSLDSNKKSRESSESEELPKEILHKIKLIEKAFK